MRIPDINELDLIVVPFRAVNASLQIRIWWGFYDYSLSGINQINVWV